jgi:hypothetical protein
METQCGSKEVFLTLVKGWYQWMRSACSAQKPSGSATERSYMRW